MPTNYFNIDYNKWKLLKNPETGKLEDPITLDEFERYDYWDDKQHNPVRQIIPKIGQPIYADYLNVKTGKLERKVASLLGWSAYDDEISKEQYEELCQTTLLDYHYRKHIDYTAILPFQRIGLVFFKYQDEVFIKKGKEIFSVNYEEKKIVNFSEQIKHFVNSSMTISEKEFYSVVIQKLIERYDNIIS